MLGTEAVFAEADEAAECARANALLRGGLESFGCHLQIKYSSTSSAPFRFYIDGEPVVAWNPDAKHVVYTNDANADNVLYDGETRVYHRIGQPLGTLAVCTDAVSVHVTSATACIFVESLGLFDAKSQYFMCEL